MAVVAIGNPLGFTGAMSSGIIHSAYTGNGYRWLCADIHLAPGNSGGPLADLSGQVLGINTMVVSGGLALAVPSRSVQAFLDNPQQRRPLGVTLRPVRGGLLILELLDGAPADQASLRPGDLLVALNEKPLQFVEDLQMAANESEIVTLDFRRGGETQVRRVVLRVPRREAVRAA
jgi:serine protease Do